MAGDIFTLDTDNNAAVRTVNVKAGAAETNSPIIFTTDENGNAAVRVVGGGDQSNLGYFTTPEALREAYPTAEAGNWAIVGSTDTVWIWDTDSGAWVDGDTKGQVTSVNNQTGAVTLGINDVAPTQTDKSGYVLGTDGFVAGWVKPEIVQRSALPQASEEEVDKIYQYIGTTDANYTNGYFYKCVSDGQVPATYSWTQVDVQPAPEALPDQTGQSGKFLTTDGTDASWGTVNALQNLATTNYSLVATGGNFSAGESRQTTYGYEASSEYCGAAYGYQAVATKSGQAFGASAVAYDSSYDQPSLAVGKNARAGTSGARVQFATAVGTNTFATNNACAIGAEADASARYSMQLGKGTNLEQGTLCFGTFYNNNWYNYKLLDSDGTIPTARLTKVNTTVTLAAADWSSNSQTANVTGMTASALVFVAPAVASQSDYTSAGIICSAQGSGTLTFTCDTTPTNDITVNVVAL